jgi:hypothetical protein
MGANLPAVPSSQAVPALVMQAGDAAGYRFLEFFAAHIRNRNTREAYYRGVCDFFAWCEGDAWKFLQPCTLSNR